MQGAKYTWKCHDVDEQQAKKIAGNHHLSLSVARVLAARGYQSDEQIRSYLFTDRERDVASSSLLMDADKAALRLIQAIERKEKILIFGDYDVDGVTSTSLVLLALLPLGAKINFFLPNRERDGYGLSTKVVKKAANSGYNLIMTVDNGVTAFEPIEAAYKAGIDVIVTDHHRPHETLPKALAVVNPNRTDCAYPCKYLAGVGVAFKVIQKIYDMLGKELPTKIYELLLLGTVADVVPLLDENRFWVRHGLSQVNQERSYALDVLANNSSIGERKLTSLDIGFMIAPQINALGRLDDPREAVTFLVSSDKRDIERIGTILKRINDERKQVDQKIFQDIERAIFNKDIDVSKENIIMAAHTGWPAGVIGLVAGKLMHSYGKPAFLFHIDTKKGIAKGSCRSIPEFDVFSALNSCSDLLLSFGGHTCAAGLKLEQKNVGELKERLEKLVAEQVQPDDLRPKLKLDAELELPDMRGKLLDDLAHLEPFGSGNPQPAFLVKNVTLVKQPQLLKDRHTKCMVFADGIVKPVIFFNRPDLFSTLSNVGDNPFHLAGHVSKNEWQGKVSIELMGLDIACASE